MQTLTNVPVNQRLVLVEEAEYKKKELKILKQMCYFLYTCFSQAQFKEENTERNLLFAILLAAFVAITIVRNVQPAEEIRVWGGKLEDFKDSKGRIWHGAENEKKRVGRLD